MKTFLKTLIASLLILGIVNCNGLAFQSGIDSTILQSGEHNLKDTSESHRELEVRVDFKNEFYITPQVFVTIQSLAFNSDQPGGEPGIGFRVQVTDRDTTGFTYNVIVDSDRPFEQLTVYWYAFVDPHVQQESYQINVFGINGDSNKNTYTYPVTFDRTLVSAPSVGAYLIGAVWNQDGGSYDVNVYVENVTEEGCDIVVGTFDQGNPYSVDVQLVVVPSDRSEVADYDWNETLDLTTESNEATSGITRYTADARAGLKLNRPQQGYSYPSRSYPGFLGLSGFNVPYGNNFYLKLGATETAGRRGGIKLKVQTEESVELSQINFALVSYQPSDDCAFLFSGCNFTGNGVGVCQDQAQNTFKGTHLEDNQVKSIYIPLDQELTLYDETNLRGRTATYSQSQECLKELVADEDRR